MARLFASVPVAVKMTSLGAQSIACAICSLACSKSFLTDRPAECKDEALPNFFIASVKAAIAGSTMVVVAA